MTQIVSDSGQGDLGPKNAQVFLARHGLEGAALIPLASDASARRYFRIPQHAMLLMADAQDPVGFASFVRLSRYLNGLGLAAPRVHGADHATCLALVEDFGDATYTACLAAGQDERALYELAIDALLHLHHQPLDEDLACAPYDQELLLDELELFPQWFAPQVALGGLDHADFSKTLRALWAEALTPVAGQRNTLVLRDFHVDNLMLLSERSGVARCGLLDFQDGVIGACEYDLVSLLQDARRDLGPGLEAAMIERYIAGAPAHLGDGAQIKQRYAILGAQRHARIAGLFHRLNQRDGKPHYLDFLPRVLRQLDQALADARLDEIAALLHTALPDWQAKGLVVKP